jgi:hypothetical protein
MAIGGVTTGGQRGFQQVIAHIANEGNALVKPSGTITILGRDGLEPLEKLRFQMDTFLPQTAIEYPVLLKRALAPGTYTALVKLAVPASAGIPATSISASRPLAISKQDVQQVFTTAVPQAPPPPGATASSSGGGGSSATWKLVVAVAGGVLLVVVLTLLAMRRRQRSAAPEPQPGPAPAVATLLRGEPEPPRAPEPEPEPEPQPRADEPEPAGDDCDHLWDVAYHHAKLGEDGVWRFPHRCRTCGREILAADVADANLSTAAPR